MQKLIIFNFFYQTNAFNYFYKFKIKFYKLNVIKFNLI